MRVRNVGGVVCLLAAALSLTGCPGPEPTTDAGVGGGSAGGSTAGGSTAGGSTAGGSTAGGSTAGGSTAGGSTAGGSGGGTTAPGDIVAVAAANPNFSLLVEAVTRANLGAALQAPTPRKTVFAPTNAAFQALLTQLGVASINDLSVDQLTIILRYHVLPVEVPASAATTLAGMNGTATSLGGTIRLGLQGSTIRLDARATVTAADVPASNGVIHVIDAVLLPSILDVATTDPRFTSLATAVTASSQPALVAQLDDNALSPGLTVFAPTNDAFSALVGALRGPDDGGTTGIVGLGSFTAGQLKPVLAYHVIATPILSSAVPASGQVNTLGGSLSVARTGSAVTVDGVPVVLADLRTANGVIHAVSSVLLPSITDIATGVANQGDFGSLAAALTVADTQSDGGLNPGGLIAALDSARADGGSYTVFAPTNGAFAGLVTALRGADDGGTTGVNALTSFTAAQVTPVLKYHVAAAPIFASQVPATATAVATLGGSVRASSTGGVTVDGARVVVANVFAKNGVVHVVDQVLLPSIADVVTTEPSLSGLASLVAGAPAVATALDGQTPFTLFAPNNTAVSAVSNPPTGQPLADLLLFHAGTSVGSAVNSPIYASTVLGLTAPVDLSTALTGRTLKVGPVMSTVRVAPNPSGGSATLTPASIQVVQPNLFTANGVIHVVNGVLVP